MRHIRVILLVALLVAALSLHAVPQRTAAQSELSPGCQAFNDPDLDGFHYSYGYELGPGGDFWAGEVIIIIAGPPAADPPPTEIQLWFDSDTVPRATAPYPGTLTYVVPADFNENGFDIISSPEYGSTWDVSCGLTRPEPPAEPADPVPGCDLGMPITASSVVGQFVSTTNAYWAPGKVSSDVVIEAGKTAWVLGMDESGEYYKIVWACSTLWVPVETLGPNYDDVWQGTPLPTVVVE
jgi:hypothetical protein